MMGAILLEKGKSCYNGSRPQVFLNAIAHRVTGRGENTGVLAVAREKFLMRRLLTAVWEFDTISFRTIVLNLENKKRMSKRLKKKVNAQVNAPPHIKKKKMQSSKDHVGEFLVGVAVVVMSTLIALALTQQMGWEVVAIAFLILLLGLIVYQRVKS